ncbi:MAG TPA: hypothetical protein DCW68_01050 [Rhodospirillaceae bacterium]|nr:MAG: hypothetical protein A2018_00565 [Alphaproteobacteria bacterium GWF2_58_20]HAU28686.1 hypothetical protein [Rhodospirillaceae bacterium]
MKILVAADPDSPQKGHLEWPGNGLLSRTVACALGRSGITRNKKEGDGATPAGHFPLLRVLYRPDRIPAPKTGLPVFPIGPDDGWCDDPAHGAYNQPVSLPFPASHEQLWREDPVYDVIVVLDCNMNPAIPGKGSAIFLHVAREGLAPTAGCVALALPDLLALLETCAPGDQMEIRPACF